MDFQSKKSFGKLRLRAFQPYHQILCILKHVKDVEDRSSLLKGYNTMYVEDVEDENTHTFLFITSLIINGFSIQKSFGKLRLRAFQPYHQILCILKHVEDVEDRSSLLKGYNTMYVEDVEDENTHTFLFITSLIINGFSIQKKFWKAET